MTAAMLSMFAGAQLVHIYYRPLDDLDVYLEREKSKLHSPSETAAASVQEVGEKN